MHVTSESFSSAPLDDQYQPLLEASIASGVQPLIAMRHLHRAKLESQPHHKWIDATTAAELAVKEVLCRAKPEIEPLLLYVPSPPFAKLYGSVLAAYLGEVSPYRSALIKGQETRNSEGVLDFV